MSELEGGCPCRKIRYKLLDKPIWVHCCHCTWCQKESGSAFALNIIIERSNVQSLTDCEPEIVANPSISDEPQKMARCPVCRICVWSNYGGTSDNIRFVRAGTLDKAGKIQPSIHIYTSTKLPWVKLGGDDIPVVSDWYDWENYWPKDSMDRFKKACAEQ